MYLPLAAARATLHQVCVCASVSRGNIFPPAHCERACAFVFLYEGCYFFSCNNLSYTGSASAAPLSPSTRGANEEGHIVYRVLCIGSGHELDDLKPADIKPVATYAPHSSILHPQAFMLHHTHLHHPHSSTLIHPHAKRETTSRDQTHCNECAFHPYFIHRHAHLTTRHISSIPHAHSHYAKGVTVQSAWIKQHTSNHHHFKGVKWLVTFMREIQMVIALLSGAQLSLCLFDFHYPFFSSSSSASKEKHKKEKSAAFFLFSRHWALSFLFFF